MLQDTVVGIEALTAFAMLVPSGNRTSLIVSAHENAGNNINSYSFTIENHNRDLQQHVNLQNLPALLNVQSRGEGCALVQVSTLHGQCSDYHSRAKIIRQNFIKTLLLLLIFIDMLI